MLLTTANYNKWIHKCIIKIFFFGSYSRGGDRLQQRRHRAHPRRAWPINTWRGQLVWGLHTQILNCFCFIFSWRKQVRGIAEMGLMVWWYGAERQSSSQSCPVGLWRAWPTAGSWPGVSLPHLLPCYPPAACSCRQPTVPWKIIAHVLAYDLCMLQKDSTKGHAGERERFARWRSKVSLFS